MKRVDLEYLKDREIDLTDSTHESLVRLVLNLEIFISHYELFNEFYPEDE